MWPVCPEPRPSPGSDPGPAAFLGTLVRGGAAVRAAPSGGCPPDADRGLLCLENAVSAFVHASEEACFRRLISPYLDVSAASSIIKL